MMYAAFTEWVDQPKPVEGFDLLKTVYRYKRILYALFPKDQVDAEYTFDDDNYLLALCDLYYAAHN